MNSLRNLSKLIWLIAIVSLLGQPISGFAQQKWPGFLGAGHSEIDVNTLPLTWSPDKNINWTNEIPGYGQSSPVIWGDQVFVTSVDGVNKEKLHVVCYALTSGEILWDYTHDSTYPQKSSVYISRAAPTPVVDQNGIFAYFESGDVIALTLAGKPKWSVSLKQRYGAPQNEFGLSASPAQLADRLILLIDDEGPAYLTAISKTDGQELWKTDRSSRRSWSSPTLVPFRDGLQVVCSSGGSIDGYSPENGEQLWTFAEVGGNNNTTPVVVAEGAILISASPGREGENAELAKQSNGLFQISRQDQAWNPHFAWTDPKPTPSWGSPIVHQNLAYWVNRVGVVYCLDVSTGETAYTERIEQGCWATPVGLGDRVYIFGKDGLTTVLAAGDQFQVLASNELWTEENPPVNNTPTAEEETEERRRAAGMFSRPTVYGVALVDHLMVVRTGSQLYCLQVTN